MKSAALLKTGLGSALVVGAWAVVHASIGGTTHAGLVGAAFFAHWATGQTVNLVIPPGNRWLVALRAFLRYPRALLVVGVLSDEALAWSPLGLVAALGLSLPGMAGEFALNGRGVGTLLLAGLALLLGGGLVFWSGPQMGWSEGMRAGIAGAHLLGVVAAFLAWRHRASRPVT